MIRKSLMLVTLKKTPKNPTTTTKKSLTKMVMQKAKVRLLEKKEPQKPKKKRMPKIMLTQQMI